MQQTSSTKTNLYSSEAKALVSHRQRTLNNDALDLQRLHFGLDASDFLRRLPISDSYYELAKEIFTTNGAHLAFRQLRTLILARVSPENAYNYCKALAGLPLDYTNKLVDFAKISCFRGEVLTTANQELPFSLFPATFIITPAKLQPFLPEMEGRDKQLVLALYPSSDFLSCITNNTTRTGPVPGAAAYLRLHIDGEYCVVSEIGALDVDKRWTDYAQPYPGIIESLIFALEHFVYDAVARTTRFAKGDPTIIITKQARDFLCLPASRSVLSYFDYQPIENASSLYGERFPNGVDGDDQILWRRSMDALQAQELKSLCRQRMRKSGAGGWLLNYSEPASNLGLALRKTFPCISRVPQFEIQGWQKLEDTIAHYSQVAEKGTQFEIFARRCVKPKLLDGKPIESVLKQSGFLAPIDRIWTMTHPWPITEFGYGKALEVITPTFSWISAGTSRDFQFTPWWDLLQKRTPGFHLIPMHIAQQGRSPALCLMEHGQDGEAKRSIWIGHKGAGLLDLKLEEIVEPLCIGNRRAPVYRGIGNGPWGEGTTHSRWGGASQDEMRDTFDNEMVLSVLMKKLYRDRVQYVPAPIDVALFADLPVWTERTVEWISPYRYQSEVLLRDPDLASRPAVLRDLSPGGPRLAGLFNRVFSRDKQSASDLDLARTQIIAAMSFLYWMHGKTISDPGSEIAIGERGVGPAEIARFLRSISKANAINSDLIYRAFISRICALTGVIHGGDGTLGGTYRAGRGGGAGGGGCTAPRNLEVSGIVRDLGTADINLKLIREITKQEVSSNASLFYLRQDQRADLVHLCNSLSAMKLLLFGARIPSGTPFTRYALGDRSYVSRLGSLEHPLTEDYLGFKKNHPIAMHVDSRIFASNIFNRHAFDQGFALQTYLDGFERGKTLL